MSKIRNKPKDCNDFFRNLRNLRISFEGLRAVWREERSFKQWSIVNLISLIALIFVRPDIFPAAIIVLAGLQILMAELLNTAIEAMIDELTTQHTPLGKLAKDAGSAAVAIALLGFVVVWGAVLLQEFT